MSLESVALEALNKRGNTFIVRIKQELKSAGKSATGSLISNTRGTTKVSGSRIIFEATAPEHYVFVDKGRRPGAKQPPLKPIQEWIKRKGLDLNAFAVARSIAKKGIKATNIYTSAINRFKEDIDLDSVLSKEVTKELKLK